MTNDEFIQEYLRLRIQGKLVRNCINCKHLTVDWSPWCSKRTTPPNGEANVRSCPAFSPGISPHAVHLKRLVPRSWEP